ncbi:uncharacterized protein CTHT_0048420 [Thermochaetoides thermophila DSM 1495]|uniref:Uncharacterized protein n=1 Tax=Chaetomium thermophilum (strain DSM 1495 / CBS 144.50 / IMI 039719) TaxID=759272 RepID=G0SB03_CHATD|nr:hypothetical protein CTHT_0048420 [Thermochaetoides thermophila DSM 1495]EGS19383.1 hypothetical protein CTHT_0048420 [Thermochaetoides thermophila DSM 1495]
MPRPGTEVLQLLRQQGGVEEGKSTTLPNTRTYSDPDPDRHAGSWTRHSQALDSRENTGLVDFTASRRILDPAGGGSQRDFCCGPDQPESIWGNSGVSGVKRSWRLGFNES